MNTDGFKGDSQIVPNMSPSGNMAVGVVSLRDVSVVFKPFGQDLGGVVGVSA